MRLCVYLYHVLAGAHRGQRASDLLALELQMFVSHRMWMLVPKSKSCAKAGTPLTTEPSLRPPPHTFSMWSRDNYLGDSQQRALLVLLLLLTLLPRHRPPPIGSLLIHPVE